ncbi:BglG family transcription antiterminator [Enterococcus ureasiticus]|uniref:Uncharacterized protein n=1 Tax=Enterococcus ureasiticus TaxID=903984 RepID=A0A1E5GA79_9ENTE|nr:PTS sugar transporter subunit IIA [Enterococcus ureasiticus]OEG09561.1 hypothetical protein BCR21_14535 [Enterococcus ureasiticus]
MRQDAILQYLYKNNLIISTERLITKFNISSRTLSNDIKLLNDVGQNNGFKIIRVRGKGFQLEINDKQKVERYVEENNPVGLLGGEDPEKRVELICLILLFSEDYLTFKKLSSLVKVSFSTIKSDMKQVELFFQQFQLQLATKAHYGTKIIGMEKNKRQAIMSLVKKRTYMPKIEINQCEFVDHFDEKELRFFVSSKLKEYDLKVNDIIFDDLILNIKIQCLRIIQQHELVSGKEKNYEAHGIYKQITEQVIIYLENNYKIYFSTAENNYLKNLLEEKTGFLKDVDVNKHLEQKIQNALEEIDRKYHTNFQKDDELTNALLSHMAPLMQRLNTNQQLENPIIESIYTRFANVFNVSLDFMSSFNKDLEQEISKDEIGYVAIYFAASLEKESSQIVDNYQKIAVICTTGGGASYLLKVNLQRLFSHSQIETFALNELESIDDSYDLLISTVPTVKKVHSVPLIFVKDVSTQSELYKIEKDLSLLKESKKESLDVHQYVLELFDKRWFSIIDEQISYLDLLKQAGEKLEQANWAKLGFTKSMLKRELMIDTIYHQGISGPHPMEQVAEKEVISVLIPTEKMIYNRKSVRIIFLINIKKNHLNLHKEISRLMIKMMEDPEINEELSRIRTYESFIVYLKKLLKKGFLYE